MWKYIDFIWQICIKEAWKSYCSGSVPIGAVILGNEGKILSKGRNQSYTFSGEKGTLFGNPLAHAEMNALINLDYSSVNAKNCSLYVTTEPCPLCMSAIYMAGIGSVHYASIEPNAGSTNILGMTEYLSQKTINKFPPEDKKLERILFIMLVEYYYGLKNGKSEDYINKWKQTFPDYVKLGQKVYENKILIQLKENNKKAKFSINSLSEFIESCS